MTIIQAVAWLFAVSAALYGPVWAQSAAPASNAAFAAPALVGMQLAVRRGFELGNVSENRLKCIEALPATAFSQAISALIDQNFTPQESEALESFMASPVGRKYAEHGLLQVYVAVGAQAPRPLPKFSDDEYGQIESFSRTAAGRLVFTRKVMESPDARRAIGLRIRELLAQCQHG